MTRRCHVAVTAGSLAALLVAASAAAQSEVEVTPRPRIATLVQEHVGAGIGQLLTIQGFDLLVPGATTVTLVPLLGGSPTTCVSVLPAAPSSGTELYVRLGVFESVNPPGCTAPIPSAIAPGLYRVVVSTPGGTSNAARPAVLRPPATPIPRRLLTCETSPCAPGTTFRPGDVMGILAYGTDLAGASALFVQGTTTRVVPAHAVFFPSDPHERGVVNAFRVPTDLMAGPALVRLRTELAAVGGGSPDPAGRSAASFSMVFTVAP